MKKLFYAVSVLITYCFLLVPPSHAGVYTDDLSRCIVENTDKEDRITFVKWMFSAMAKHPAVKTFVSASEEQADVIDKNMAELFMSLLVEDCKEKAQKAIQYEGRVAMETAFQVLGQVAARDLLSDPDVLKSLSGMEKYIDLEKLSSLKAD